MNNKKGDIDFYNNDIINTLNITNHSRIYG